MTLRYACTLLRNLSFVQEAEAEKARRHKANDPTAMFKEVMALQYRTACIVACKYIAYTKSGGKRCVKLKVSKDN